MQRISLMNDYLYDAHGQQFAWIENGRDVFDNKTREKYATVGENGNLYSLKGEFLNIHLENINGGGSTSNPDTVVKLKKLATENYTNS
jgi:hypothetical protein